MYTLHNEKKNELEKKKDKEKVTEPEDNFCATKCKFNRWRNKKYIGPVGASGVSSFPFLHHKFFIWFRKPLLVAET